MARDTVLFLPGLLCDRAVWEAQISALSDRYECIVADYGVADSLAAMAQRALAVAPERFVLVGHSMGGRVALEMMRNASERITGLSLLDTGYQGRPAGTAGETEALQRHHLLDIALSSGMRAMGREWVQGMVSPERLGDAALIECILEMIERKTPEIFAAQIRALLARPCAESVLRATRCPTLILCGRLDAWSPLTRHEEMARIVRGSRLVVIEGSGHMVTLERPQQVNEALRSWLSLD